MIVSFSILIFSIIITFIITSTIVVLLTVFVLQKKINMYQQKNIELKTRITSAEETIEQSRNIEERMLPLFKSLSADVLQNNSSMYLKQTREQLYGLVNPLMQDMHKLEGHIREVEKSRTGAYSSLITQLAGIGKEMNNLRLSTQNLQATTKNLDSVLRSDNVTRGKWGEMQLRRIVEMSGMQKHIDFDEQV